MKSALLKIYLRTMVILSIAVVLPCACRNTSASAAVAVAEWTALPAATLAEEDFDAAFRSRAIPWFDAEASEIKTPTPPQQEQSAVGDRNRVPPKRRKKKGQAVIKPIPNTRAPVGGGTAGTGAAGAFGTSVIYVAGAVLLVALIGLLLYGFLKLESDGGDLSRDDSKRKRKIKDHIKHLPFELDEQEGDFESFAERALRAGDYSKAVVYLFADLLVAMNDAGILRLQRGKTNRQYLNEIWDHEDIRPYYRNVMTAFEDAFFGQHEISESRAQECFAARPDFDVAIEKIRQQKFATAANEPALATSAIRIEGAV